MSFRSEKLLSLLGEDFSNKSTEDLIELFRKYLKNGVHGLCFSSYVEGQGPGRIITAKNKSGTEFKLLNHYTSWIRTFSCTDGNELIPSIAKENGLKVMVGAWLGDDKEQNELEIENLIKVVKAGNADLVAVGNEVLYREELTRTGIIGIYIQGKETSAGGTELDM